MPESLLTKLTKTAQNDIFALDQLFRGNPEEFHKLARERKTLHLSLFVGAIIATNIIPNFEYFESSALAREAPAAPHKVELVKDISNNQEAIKGFGNIHIPLSTIEKHKDRFSICSAFQDFRFRQIGFDGCTTMIARNFTDTTFDGSQLSDEAYEKLNSLGVKKIFFDFSPAGPQLQDLTSYVSDVEQSLTNNNVVKLKRNNQSDHEVTTKDFDPKELTYLVTVRVPQSFNSVGPNAEIINLSSKLEIGNLNGGSVINGYSTIIGTVNGKVITNYTNNLSGKKALTIDKQTGGWIIWQMGDRPQMPTGLQAFLDSKQAELRKLIESEKSANPVNNQSPKSESSSSQSPKVTDEKTKLIPENVVDNNSSESNSNYSFLLPSLWKVSSNNNPFIDNSSKMFKGLEVTTINTFNGLVSFPQVLGKLAGVGLVGTTEADKNREKSEAAQLTVSGVESFVGSAAGCALGAAAEGLVTEGLGSIQGCAWGSTAAGDAIAMFNQREKDLPDTFRAALGGDKNASLAQIVGYQLGQLVTNGLGAKVAHEAVSNKILQTTNPVDDAERVGQNQRKGSVIETCAQESIDVEGAKTCGFKIDGQESTPEKKQEIIKHGGEFVIESLDRNGKVIVVRQDIEFVTLRDTEEFISKKLEVNIREKLNWNQPQKFEIEGVEFEPLQDNSGQAYSFGGKGFTDGEIRLHPQGHSEQPQDLNSMKNHVNLEYTKDRIRYRSHLVYKQ